MQQWGCPVVQQAAIWKDVTVLTLLNAELNPICHLLALLGAHHILYVVRVRVNDMNDIAIMTPRTSD